MNAVIVRTPENLDAPKRSRKCATIGQAITGEGFVED